jgi:predicted hotdog family 3-hydroxylacyl-ACP dehydratase
MLVTKAQLVGLIPHEGAMCLLDGVVRWDDAGIACISSSHHDERNPLRKDGELRALCGIEYAAQAMAMHGALTGEGPRARAGYLASLRDVVCQAERLDEREGELLVEAEQLARDGRGASYRFTVRVGDAEILSGRATVVFDADRAAA